MAATHPAYDKYGIDNQSPSSNALADAALGGGDDDDAEQMDQQMQGEKKSKKEEIIVHDDDAFFKKYGVPVLLGPFLPAIFAIIVIVSGEITLQTWTGSCGFDLPAFISAAIVVCYLFLLVYSWIFIGDTIKLQSKSLGIDFTLFRPFRSLRTVGWLYFILAILSLIVWIAGTILLQLSTFCQSTAPKLYQYTLFLVVTYWIGFFITLFYLIKLFFGSNIAKMVKDATRASTIDEIEERIFKSKFQMFDKEKENKLKVEDLPPLLEALGVYVPEEEVSTLQSTLDPEETGFISFHDMLVWFKKLNSELEQRDDNNDDYDEDGYGDDDDEDNVRNFRQSSKKKSFK